MRIAVAGGTGMVGRLVVSAAREAGHDVVPISRSAGVDVVTGSGLAAAVTGCDVVVDVLNAPGISRKASVNFFDATTARLLAAERAAGVGHHLALSIVGIDRVPSGYYEGKRRQEALIEAGDVPWTVLRATQFHEFAAQMLEHAIGPIVPVPRMRIATVAAREVAGHLLELATGSPAGRVPELSGPDEYDLPGLVRRLLAARQQRGWVIPLRMPGAAGKAMAGRGLLPTQLARVGRQTYDEWLVEQST